MEIKGLDQWTSLRYDYYVAGRTLWFSNQLQTGALMLGYAIEAHLKHVLTSIGNFSRKLTHQHNFHDLFSVCRENDILQDVEVSEDLLDYVEDNFHRRYPSQTTETLQNAKSVGHAISISPVVITAYDDFIFQLDHSIAHTLSTPRASIGMLGGKRVDCLDGKFFFHSNYTAIARLSEIISLCEKDLELLHV